MKVKLESNQKYSICSCGLSKKLPYCDNAHRVYNSINGTEYKSIKLTPEIDIELEVRSSRWKSVINNTKKR